MQSADSQYKKFDASDSKELEALVVIAGWPTMYSVNRDDYSIAGDLATAGFSDIRKFADYPQIDPQKVKGKRPEEGGYSVGGMKVALLDRYTGSHVAARELTDFASRGSYLEGNQSALECTLDEDLTAAETDITVDDTSGFADSGVIYISQEAIHYTGKTGTSFTGCTRGYLLTKARPHLDGVIVYAYPPIAKGRDIYIYKGYQTLALNYWIKAWGGVIDGVDPSPARILLSARSFAWFTFGGRTPNRRKNALGIERSGRALSGSGSGAKKIVRLGQISDTIESEAVDGNDLEDLLLWADYQVEFRTPLPNPTGLGDGHFMLRISDQWFGIVSPLVDETTDGDETVVTAQVVKGLGSGDWDDVDVEGARLDIGWSNATFNDGAAITGSEPIELLLQFQLSTLGDGANGTFDDFQRGIGLGIPAAYVDTSSYTAIQSQYDYDDAGVRVFFAFSEATDAKEFFDAELCRPFGWYQTTGNDGRLKLVRPKNPTKFYLSKANFSFAFTAGGAETFTIPSGVYTGAQLAARLAAGFLAATGEAFTVTFSSGLFTITRPASATWSFTIADSWRTIGFTSSKASDDAYTSDAAVGVVTDTSSSNDFNSVDESHFEFEKQMDTHDLMVAEVQYFVNYDWTSETFGSVYTFTDRELSNLSDEIAPLEIESRGLIRAFAASGVNLRSPWRTSHEPASGCIPDDFDVSSSFGMDATGSYVGLVAQHYFDRYRVQPIYIKGRLPWKFNRLEVGDNILFSYGIDGVIVDFERGRNTVSERVMEVVSCKQDFKNGRIEVELLSHRQGNPTIAEDELPIEAPSDVDDLLAWWRGDSVSGADGDPVSSWADDSGNGNTVTGSSGTRPTVQTEELNGLGVVRYDGSDDKLTKTMAASLFGASDDATIFFVIKPGSSSVEGILSQDGGGGNDVPKWALFRSLPGTTAGTISWHMNGPGQGSGHTVSSTTAYASGSWHLGCLRKSGNDYAWFKDGVADGTGSIAFNFPTNTADLAVGEAEGVEWTGDIAEIVVFNRALTTAEREAIESYLRTRWGL